MIRFPLRSPLATAPLRSLAPVARAALLAVVAAGLAGSGGGCSSKPAEVDTAEATPDPAVRPAPAPNPAPAATPTPGAEGAASAPAGPAAAAAEAKP